MTRATHFPFYPSDWLGGVAGLTPAQVGVYINMLALIYDAGGPIVLDTRRLARRMCCPVGTFKNIIDDLISVEKLVLIDGHLTNPRAEIELEKLNQKRVSASESAKTRWQEKPNKTTGESMRTHSERNANQSQSQNHILDTDVSNRNAREPLGDFEAFWKAWPNKVGKPAAVKSYQSAMKRGHSHEQVMEGLRRYIRGKPPDRPWLNPATFLNQERYNDEPAASYNTQANHITINPDGSPSAETFGRTIPFPNKQGLGGRAGAALRSLQERAGMDWDR
jgi:uncharacterized protein YdaU (DUF1376 family)